MNNIRNRYQKAASSLLLIMALLSGLLPLNRAKAAGSSVIGWGDNTFGVIDIPAGLSDAIAISAGRDHSLALKSDGTVVAWGYNSHGQIPVPAGLSNVVAISAGLLHSLALKNDGTVVAWGEDSGGQTDVPAGLSNVIAIAAGSGHNLALKADGTVVGWGANGSGQINVPAGLSNVIAIAAGGNFSLALKSDGTVVAWGDNGSGQTDIPAGLGNVIAISAGGYHSLALKSDGTLVAWGNNDYGQTDVPAGLSDVIAIAAGYYYSLALKSDGTVVGWGDNADGQLNIPAGLHASAIAAGFYHSLALGTTAAPNAGSPVVAWGANFAGQTDVPVGLSDAIAISAGYGFSLALKSDGTVLAWGDNWGGQTDVPAGLSEVIAIDAGSGHSLALKSDGTLVAWGDNYYGEVSVPAGLSNVIAISAGGLHSLALKSDGTVVGWGYNFAGEINIPAGLSSVIAIDAGNEYSLALKSDGTLVAWGLDDNGQTDIPAGLGNVIAISAGGYHSLALKSDGTVVGWGNNDYGQTDVPAGLSDVIAISAGSFHNLALKSDGTVVAWGSGDNFYGQVNVPAGLHASAIAVGAYHSLALGTLAAGDTTPPELIKIEGFGPQAINGWYNGPLTVHFIIQDNEFAITSQTGCGPITLDTDTPHITLTCTATSAGGTNSWSVAFRMDMTAPVISAAATTSANPAGWYKGNVTVHFTCTDATSGIPAGACPADQVLSSEGAAVASTAQTVTDTAGNVSLPSNIVTVKIDKTAPVISAAATTSANPAGWYKGNVSVHFTCTDALSGIPAGACPADQVLSSEGTAVASTAQTVTDAAGNVSLPSNIVTVKIDKTAPMISAAVTTSANAAGWYKGNVSVHFTCTDALSGIPAGACPADQVLSSEGTAVTSTAQTVTDAAGNVSLPSNIVTVKIDKTAPLISAAATKSPNLAGWYNGNVGVHFTCTDALSGIPAGACPANQVLKSEGAAVSSTARTVTDVAGNVSLPSNIVTVKIDKSAPTLNPVVSPNPVLLNGSAAVTSGAADALSGLASQSCGALNTSSVGSKSVTCMATDKAGNSTSASASYQVNYNISNLLAPVNSPPTVNTGKAGLTYPIKWQLTDANDAYIKTLTAFSFGRYVKVSCGAFSGAPTDPLETSTTGKTSLRYDTSVNQFIYNWATPGAGCYVLGLRLDSGQTIQADFNLSK